MADNPLPHGFVELTTGKETEETFNLISGAARATRMFSGPWSARFQFILEYLLVPVTNADGVTLYSVPQAYPDYPLIHADNVKIKGDGVGSVNEVTGQAQWDRAIITCEYNSHTFNFASQPATSTWAYVQGLFIDEEFIGENAQLSVESAHVKLDGAVSDESQPHPIVTGKQN